MSSTKVITPTVYPASKLLNLPLELLSVIISNVASPSPSAESSPPLSSSSNPPTHSTSITDNLISLSLSHPTLAILAAPYLLRNLTLTVSTRSSALIRLSRLVTIVRSVPSLEGHVRHLKWILEDSLKLEDSPTLSGDLIERFSCLPNLESLEIHCGIPLSSSYTSSQSDFDDSKNDGWYWKPLYRPNYVSEAIEPFQRSNSSTAADSPTYSSPPQPPLSNPSLNFYSIFTSYIPLTSNAHQPLPKLTNVVLSGITSLPLIPIFQLPTLESLTLLKCNGILKYDGPTSALHPPGDLPNHALKHFKAVEVFIYIGLDDKTTPSLPWFLKDVETMWLEDFGYRVPDPTTSDSNGYAKRTSGTPFSYRRLKKLTCAGITDFHPLVGTGYNTDLNPGDVSPAPSPFLVLREFVFEQTSSYPTDHLCSLYPYFQNLEVLQTGLTSQPQLNAHPPLYQSNLVPILSRPEGYLKSLIIRRYESASDALEALQDLSDALSAPSDLTSPRIPTLQSIIIDLTLTSSDMRHLERLGDAWDRLSSGILAKKTGGESRINLKRVEMMVGLVWTPEIMVTQQERDGWKHVERHDSAMGWHSNSPSPWESDSWGSFTGWADLKSDSGSRQSRWDRDENDHAHVLEEYNQSDTSTSSYASSSSQSSRSPLSSPSSPCFPTPTNQTSSAFDFTTRSYEPHSIEWDESPTDDELKALLERPLIELVARSRELDSEVEVSINVVLIRNEEGYR